MSTHIQQTEGIVLRIIPFRDHDQIITLFTPDLGVMKIIHKEKHRALCQPLTKIEILYREKKGEIFACHEIHLIESFSALRSTLPGIEASCDFVQAILASQYTGKAAPLLYQLFSYYLKKIPSSADPWVLAASFRLKILKHEGLLSFPFVCNDCQVPLSASAYVYGSELWCKSHKPVESWLWTGEEIDSCYLLTHCQNYREICLEQMTGEKQKKIFCFFDACIQQ